MFVLAFQQQEVLLQTSKVEIEFSMLFGLPFHNCFYPPKTIFLEATISRFGLFYNQFYIKFYILIITTNYFPLLPFINYHFFCFVINLMNQI